MPAGGLNLYVRYMVRHHAASALPVHPRTRKYISSLRNALGICLNRAEGSQNGLIAALGTLGIFDLPVWGREFVGGYACGDVSANCSESAGEEKWRTCQDVLRNLGRLDCDCVLWSFDPKYMHHAEFSRVSLQLETPEDEAFSDRNKVSGCVL
jgi:hypothetical protein